MAKDEKNNAQLAIDAKYNEALSVVSTKAFNDGISTRNAEKVLADYTAALEFLRDLHTKLLAAAATPAPKT